MACSCGGNDPAVVSDWDLLFGEEVLEEGGAGYFVGNNGPHARDTCTVACVDNLRQFDTVTCCLAMWGPFRILELSKLYM